MAAAVIASGAALVPVDLDIDAADSRTVTVTVPLDGAARPRR